MSFLCRFNTNEIIGSSPARLKTTKTSTDPNANTSAVNDRVATAGPMKVLSSQQAHGVDSQRISTKCELIIFYIGCAVAVARGRCGPTRHHNLNPSKHAERVTLHKWGCSCLKVARLVLRVQRLGHDASCASKCWPAFWVLGYVMIGYRRVYSQETHASPANRVCRTIKNVLAVVSVAAAVT